MSEYQDPKKPFVPDRSKLPIHEPVYPPITTYNAKNATPPPRFTVKPPEGAPNVVIALIDDMGFGASSVFGGPVPMPTAEKIAKKGMRFNRFHTTAVCAPLVQHFFQDTITIQTIWDPLRRWELLSREIPVPDQRR